MLLISIFNMYFQTIYVFYIAILDIYVHIIYYLTLRLQILTPTFKKSDVEPINYYQIE